MGKNNKKKSSLPPHDLMTSGFPQHASTSQCTIIDTHTHLLSTFALYRSKYPEGQYETAFDFVKGVYAGKGVETIVDVWCEPEVFMRGTWKELADGKWEGIQYRFVIGVHPHEAKSYTPAVESEILTALEHSACVGLGEIGLDYHYTLSPPDVQQRVFAQQLRIAVDRGIPITVHTREAEEDTERIMKEIVPKDHRVHIHCFTDTAAFGLRLLEYFPNLHIGVTGVVCYASNLNTSDLLKQMAASGNKRILLETDAPYMVPANVYGALEPKQSRLPFSHSLMIPWTAEFVAEVMGEGWDAERVLNVAREGARRVYGV
ncbi:Metallo-dependent hydrolase [Desarmillaria tabescens]|uniref:Metallo-dependent hydrolase n=1 Tax=Armillaria tabescens TaxID=1929756 RepID=A0AA39NBJ5_ARMTA|nr:Metallo-dependent hydrolase [Desarmillaria tabescens]KAK0462579.1 Metallo-dependent hydrolase [Desarmillaria tabescens]